MDLTPRAVIAGRYRVDTKVGAGGMGEVWLGEHIAVGTRVAVKTLLPAAAMNHEVVARFKREAQAAAWVATWSRPTPGLGSLKRTKPWQYSSISRFFPAATCS